MLVRGWINIVMAVQSTNQTTRREKPSVTCRPYPLREIIIPGLWPSRKGSKRTSNAKFQISISAMTAVPVSSIRIGAKAGARNGSEGTLPPRPQLQAFQPGGDADPNLALQAERLQRDGVVGAADQ